MNCTCLKIMIKVSAEYLTKYRGFPTYTKLTNTVSTTTVFGLCTCKWGIFALVGNLLQSHKHKFHVTRFFPSPKMRVRRGPFVVTFENLRLFLCVPPSTTQHALHSGYVQLRKCNVCLPKQPFMQVVLLPHCTVMHF